MFSVGCAAPLQETLPAPTPETPENVVRLSDKVIPSSYSLEFYVDPTQETFTGRTQIHIKLEEATSALVLHGQDLQVGSVTITPEGKGSKGIAATWTQTHDDGTALIELCDGCKPLDQGSYTVDISYEAPFAGDLDGLYRVEYDGNWYAFTQFEPLAARKAFPSFDEPKFKTPFSVTIHHRPDNIAIANEASTASTSRDDGWTTQVYKTTEPSPTYLVALAVGPFDILEEDPIPPSQWRETPIRLRGIAAKGKAKALKYALDAHREVLLFQEAHLQTAYAFGKIDFIAVPDFQAGAMENTGAITYRDFLLLIDPETATIDQRRSSLSVIAHEIAHQWFGNLVTMPWWDDLWLNESFATWFEGRTLRAIRPEWKPELSDRRSHLSVMGRDAQRSARQIRQPVLTTGDVRNAFDGITYTKGSAVLTMLETYLGTDAFARQVGQYIRKHAHGHATAADFIASLAKLDPKAGDSLASFIKQPGLPLLEMDFLCHEGREQVQFEQRRFEPVAANLPQSTLGWRPPFCLRSDAKPSQLVCGYATPGATFDLGACDESRTWIPDAGGTAYARYHLKDKARLRSLLASMPSLSVAERLTLGSNTEALLNAGLVTPRDLVMAAEGLIQSGDRWSQSMAFGWIIDWMEDVLPPSAKPTLATWAAERVRDIDPKYGLTTFSSKESESEALHHRAVLRFLADVAEDAKTLASLQAHGQAWLEKRAGPEGPLPESYASTALGVFAEQSSEEAYPLLKQAIQTETDPSRRRTLLRGLTSLTGESSQLLRDEYASIGLRANEIASVLVRNGTKPENRDAAWAWLQDNAAAVKPQVPAWHFSWMPWMASRPCSEEQENAVNSLFEPLLKDVAGGNRSLKKVKESMSQCRELNARIAQELEEALRGRSANQR